MVKADASIIRVPNDFPTIQEAIDAAQNGSTILVNSGIYYEHVIVNKTLRLLGADKENTIIDGSNDGSVIVITADNVLVDGFTLRNSSRGLNGLRLVSSTGSIIRGNVITLNGWAGIELDDSTNNTVSDNVVSSTGFDVGGGDVLWGDAIMLSSSSNNTISNNVIADSFESGIHLETSYGNSVFGNTLQNNPIGIAEPFSGNNTFFHNNFIRNFVPIEPLNSSDAWSLDGRGNYWDDYTGLDDGSGGRVAGDGVGDTDLPCHDVDYYPLISPANPLLILLDNTAFSVSLVSNCTVYGDASRPFGFDQSYSDIAAMVFGPANTTGYFNLTLPKTLLSVPWEVRMDGNVVSAHISENQTHTTIYLNYSNNGQHSHYILIGGTVAMPEYPTASILLLLVLPAILLTILTARKRRRKSE
jgi:parallel beta-helix repeat protein